VFFRFCKTNFVNEKAVLFYVTSLLQSDIQMAATAGTERWLCDVQYKGNQFGGKRTADGWGEVNGGYYRLMSCKQQGLMINSVWRSPSKAQWLLYLPPI
jgi:hypothetical protein